MNPEVPIMFTLAMLSVGMWTLRVTVAARGLKLAGAGIAAAEALVFALTFSHLVTDLSSPSRLVAYGAGVAAGTALGLSVNDRTTHGHSELHLVASGDRTDLVECFRRNGWPATSTLASGPDGAVTAMWLTVSDAEIGDVTHLAEEWAPDAFWTTRSMQRVASMPSRTPRREVSCQNRS
jgi:uncharacterized protein YebE (UPF0316 family)